MHHLHTDLPLIRRYFQTGATRPYAFRIKQLQALKQAVNKFEEEIYTALYIDLKKNREEAYASEIGLVLAEINTTLRNLNRWMQPKQAPTDLPNLPSSSKIYRDPLGVVLIIAPWNYPLQLVFIPLVGAIAGGNCAVLKPSELAPATAAIIEKIIIEIFQTDYVNVVQGEGAELIPEMMKQFRFDHVFYTGSIPVGKLIYQMAAEELVPVTLELGGKSPAIVEKDANLGVAARRITLGKFTNAGQTCIAPDYVLVHQNVKEKFVNELKNTITRFYSENPAECYEYGKLINEKRFDKMVSYLKEGKVVYGGQHNKTKLFFSPTIMEDTALNASLMTEEIFGPILPVHSFNSREEAMKIVQLNPNPLAFYLFTTSNTAEKEWINNIPFGGGCINNADWHFTNYNLPFGGVGSSGFGAYHGKYSFETFTRAKAVMKTPNWFDPAIKYPPLKGKLKLFKWLIR